MTIQTVDKALFDDVLRTCSDSVDQSKHYMTICHGLIGSLELALMLLKSGRIEQARLRLESAAVTTRKLMEKRRR